MKTITKKSEITSTNLKKQDCNYNGSRLGFDKTESFYFIGFWWNEQKSFYDTIKDLKIQFS